jgi:hypothetical protein
MKEKRYCSLFKERISEGEISQKYLTFMLSFSFNLRKNTFKIKHFTIDNNFNIKK